MIWSYSSSGISRNGRAELIPAPLIRMSTRPYCRTTSASSAWRLCLAGGVAGHERKPFHLPMRSARRGWAPCPRRDRPRRPRRRPRPALRPWRRRARPAPPTTTATLPVSSKRSFIGVAPVRGHLSHLRRDPSSACSHVPHTNIHSSRHLVKPPGILESSKGQQRGASRRAGCGARMAVIGSGQRDRLLSASEVRGIVERSVATLDSALAPHPGR